MSETTDLIAEARDFVEVRGAGWQGDLVERLRDALEAAGKERKSLARDFHTLADTLGSIGQDGDGWQQMVAALAYESDYWRTCYKGADRFAESQKARAEAAEKERDELWATLKLLQEAANYAGRWNDISCVLPFDHYGLCVYADGKTLASHYRLAPYPGSTTLIDSGEPAPTEPVVFEPEAYGTCDLGDCDRDASRMFYDREFGWLAACAGCFAKNEAFDARRLAQGEPANG